MPRPVREIAKDIQELKRAHDAGAISASIYERSRQRLLRELDEAQFVGTSSPATKDESLCPPGFGEHQHSQESSRELRKNTLAMFIAFVGAGLVLLAMFLPELSSNQVPIIFDNMLILHEPWWILAAAIASGGSYWFSMTGTKNSAFHVVFWGAGMLFWVLRYSVSAQISSLDGFYTPLQTDAGPGLYAAGVGSLGVLIGGLMMRLEMGADGGYRTPPVDYCDPELISAPVSMPTPDLPVRPATATPHAAPSPGNLERAMGLPVRRETRAPLKDPAPAPVTVDEVRPEGGRPSIKDSVTKTSASPDNEPRPARQEVLDGVPTRSRLPVLAIAVAAGSLVAILIIALAVSNMVTSDEGPVPVLGGKTPLSTDPISRVASPSLIEDHGKRQTREELMPVSAGPRDPSWLKIVEPLDGASVDNPVHFRVQTSPDIDSVELEVDGYSLGKVGASGTLEYDFQGTGRPREVVFKARSEGSLQFTEKIVVTPVTSSWVKVEEPQDGATVDNPVLFRIQMSSDIDSVELIADGWSLGKVDAQGILSYSFRGTGRQRTVIIEGSSAGKVAATERITITPQ